MRSFQLCFWVGLALRLACAPIFQYFGLLPHGGFWGKSQLSPFTDEALCAAIGVWSWIGFWTLIRWFRKSQGPKGDSVALVLAWFFALFWAFPLVYLRFGVDALAFTPICMLWMAIERRHSASAGWWAGWSAVLWLPGALWGVGAALLTAVRLGISGKTVHAGRMRSELLGVSAGLGAALLLGVLGNLILGGGKIFSAPSGLATAVGAGSLAAYWHWFEYLFSPWLAPVFLAAAVYALGLTPGLLFFSTPYVALTFFRADRDPSFMLALTPFLALAIAVAVQRGRFDGMFWKAMGVRRGFWIALRVAGLALLALNFVWGALFMKAQSRAPGVELPEVSWPALLESGDAAKKLH